MGVSRHVKTNHTNTHTRAHTHTYTALSVLVDLGGYLNYEALLMKKRESVQRVSVTAVMDFQ